MKGGQNGARNERGVVFGICWLVLAVSLTQGQQLKWSLKNPLQTTQDVHYADYGNGVFVFFAGNSVILSSDLAQFDVVTPDLTSNPLNWVGGCFFDPISKFVAIAEYESTSGQGTLLIALSTNGTDWVPVAKFVEIFGHPSVACGNKQIILSTGIEIVESEDGNNWSVRDPAFSLYEVFYAPQKDFYIGFVNLPAIPNLFTSDKNNGTHGWRVHQGPPGTPYRGIAFGNGVWVVAGARNVYWSSNFAGWSVSTLPDLVGGGYTALDWNERLQLFVTTSWNSTDRMRVYTSSDGNDWKEIGHLDSLEVSRIHTVEPKTKGSIDFLMVGQVGLLMAVSKSATSVSLLSGQDLFADLQWVVKKSSGIFVSGASNNDIYSSKDGVIWNKSSHPPSNLTGAMSKPVESNGVLVGISFTQTFLLSSSDGIQWSISLNATYYNLRSFSLVSPTKTGFIASGVGPLQNELFVSSDGFKWTRLETNVTSSLTSIISLQSVGLFLGRDSVGRLWASSDQGTTWSATETFFSNAPQTKAGPWLVSSNYVVWMGLPFIYVAPLDRNSILNNKWRSERWRNSFSWIDSTVVKNNFVLLGSNDQYATSTDGMNWNTYDPPQSLSVQLNSLVADPSSSMVVIVGNSGVVFNASL